MAEDEFYDDIDWSEVAEMPTPTSATPYNNSKRPRLDDNNYGSSLLRNLDMAPSSAFGGGGDDDQAFDYSTTRGEGDGGDDDEERGGMTTMTTGGDAMQVKAIELATVGRENLFLTGKAGTGKSWTTKRILERFEKDGRIIHLTAPTGIAAINIGGTTIHRWGCFRKGQYYEDFNNMMSPRTREKIRMADALLIDEISMLDGHLFDVLECMISIVRNYRDLSDKLRRIKDAAGSGDNIMSPLVLKLRWDTIPELGLGDVPAFGGMQLQLIVVGDFYQLPPVPAGHDVLLMKNENMREGEYESKIGRQGSYAFESHAWNHGHFRTVELTEVHRHAEDDGLFEFLNAMREGRPDLAIEYERVLDALRAPLPRRRDGIIPTELHALNRNVDDRNNQELHKLSTNLHEFVSLDEVELDYVYRMKILKSHGLQDDLAHLSFRQLIGSPSLPEYALKQIQADLEVFTSHAGEQFFQNDCRVDHNFELKTDAQVMLLWNLDLESKLANGSRGVVKGFFPSAGYCHLLRNEEIHRNSDSDGREGDMGYNNDSEEASFVSKCDDRTGDHNEEASWDNSKKEATSDGMGDNFVDLTGDNTPSKATQVKSERKHMHHSPDATLSSAHKLRSTGFDLSQVNPEFVVEVKSQLANMETDLLQRELQHMEKVESKIKELPFIQFANGTCRVIKPQPFSKVFKDIGTATRWQIPLTLAWAISIHKSQGMTIEFLHVDLSNFFADGQAYVACSRGKSITSMTVKNFRPTEIKTSKKVRVFYEAVKNGKPYTGGTWSDTIAAFDEGAKKDIEKQKEMKLRYTGKKCGSECILGLAQTGSNRGKYYLSCPNGRRGERGHTWELVRQSNSQANNDRGQKLKLLTPGVDGAIEGRLSGKRFVVTGVFPELGGGSELTLGRDRLKAMIESFDGKVTSAISGKTNCIIVGDEPGEKRLEEARSKGKPIINRATLHKILTGESQRQCPAHRGGELRSLELNRTLQDQRKEISPY